MRRVSPVSVDRRAEGPGDRPRPFSQEWLATSPHDGGRLGRRLPVLPGWMPAEGALSGLLVLVLVLATVIASGGAAPRTVAGVAGSGTGGALTATENPEGQTQALLDPTAATTARAQPTVAVAPAEAVETPTLVAGLALTPATGGESVGDPRALLPNYRVLAYYGHPLNDTMGILGEYSKDDLLAQLLDEKAAYEAADPSRPVMPAFELIATVAQNWDPGDGTYLLQTDEALIDEYVEFTQAKGIQLILDVQIGHSTVEAEIEQVKRWLVEPNVHLALDPEFAMAEGDIPGTAIGSIDASDVAVAQEALAAIVAENDLPPKILIVHRFTEGMITNPEEIAAVAGVQTVIDFDGFGEPGSKQEFYELFIKGGSAEFGAIKLFYQQDSPLMTATEIVALDPPPDLVIYH